VLFVGVGEHFFRDLAPQDGRVAKLVEGLPVRGLEIVVHHATLLLLSQGEVVRLELGFKITICNFLCKLACRALRLVDVLMFGLARDLHCRGARPEIDAGAVELRANVLAVGRLPAILRLLVNLACVERLVLAHVFVCTSKSELSLREASFELISLVLLIRGYLMLVQV